MINGTLTDSTGTLDMPAFELGFKENTIENSTDVETLDANIYTDFINKKRQWTITYKHITEASYEALRGYYDRQFTLYKYPVLAIAHYSFDAPVRMYMNERAVWSDNGEVQGVVITLRETNQLP